MNPVRIEVICADCQASLGIVRRPVAATPEQMGRFLAKIAEKGMAHRYPHHPHWIAPSVNLVEMPQGNAPMQSRDYLRAVAAGFGDHLN